MSGGADHTNVPIPARTRRPGNDPVRWVYRTLTGGNWAAELTTMNGAQARAKSRVEEGNETTKKTRENASIAVGSAGMK